MADKKISALTGATTPLAGTEVLPIVQGSATVKVSVADLTAGRAVAMAGGSFTDNITQGTAAKGINFTANTPAANMTSQLLNWYEQGTWTPTDGSGAGLTLTSQSGVYTRIGNTVYFNCVAQYPVTANTSLFKIGSLPFTPNRDGGASIGYTTYGTSGALFVQISNAVNGLRLFTTGGSFLTNANMSNVLITITGTFTVN